MEVILRSEIVEGTGIPKTHVATGQVSVIIVSFFTGPLLARSVLSALKQPDVFEVIIVDNGNSAHEIARLQAILDQDKLRARIVTGHGNIGYAAGCNRGARLAKGEYLFLLNPDAILPDNAVAELLQEARGLENDMWLIGGKLINPDGTEQAGSRRQPLTPGTAFVEMTQLYRFAPKHPYFRRFNAHQDPCPKQTSEIPVISGACMLMQTETYRSIGGMDEAYFLHVEDVDFCLRLRDAGGQVYFAPNTDILHHKSSSRSNPIRVETRKAKSMVLYFNTHFTDAYPKLFLHLMSVLVWTASSARIAKHYTRHMLCVLGLRTKTTRHGQRRARQMAINRNNR